MSIDIATITCPSCGADVSVNIVCYLKAVASGQVVFDLAGKREAQQRDNNNNNN